MALGAMREGAHLWAKPLRESKPNKGTGADCLKRPLRSRFRQQLMPSVRPRRAGGILLQATPYWISGRQRQTR